MDLLIRRCLYLSTAVAICMALPLTSLSQNVGIGTTAPEYKLDIRDRLDTTLMIKTTGENGVNTTSLTRVGILNTMDELTDGNRIGMLTTLNYPKDELVNAYDYIGQLVNVNGICIPSPIGSCGNNANIYGYKVTIPILASGGTQYGVHSEVPSAFGYAGYFDGRGYFGAQVGIGMTPDANSSLYVQSNNRRRAGRFICSHSEATTSDVEGIQVTTIGNSSDQNIGGRFIATGQNGTTYGVYAQANANGGGNSYGLSALNSSNEGTRYGMRTEVSGNSGGAMFGISSLISGNGGTTGIPFAVHAVVETVSSTIGSYGVYAENANNGPADYAALFSGRTAIAAGNEASYAGNGGFLVVGQVAGSNIAFDNNEILARNNGTAAPLYVQSDGGDIMLCSTEEGAVGIGITTNANLPNGYLLAVDGNGVFEELKVELSESWPDYVFQNNYPLKSIDELKDFIEANGHLPNIPTAESLESEGLLVGEMQRRMMEKIEELTLYIINQDERIRQLESAAENK